MSNIYVHTRAHSKKGEVKNRETQNGVVLGGILFLLF